MYPSPDKNRMSHTRRTSWAAHVAGMGRRVIHMEFWWEQEGQRPIMRPIRRWEDNIKMYLRETG